MNSLVVFLFIQDVQYCTRSFIIQADNAQKKSMYQTCFPNSWPY